MGAPLRDPGYGGASGAPVYDGSNANGAGGIGRTLVAAGVAPLQSIQPLSTAAAAGAALDCGVTVSNALCVCTTPAGTYTTGAVTFEGSMDGTNWYTIGAALTLASGATTPIPGTAALPAVGRFFRARISTGITGAGASVGCMVGAVG